MFDTRKYTDLVTLWIKGFAALHFEIQIRREQLEVLQVKSLYKCTIALYYTRKKTIFAVIKLPIISFQIS